MKQIILLSAIALLGFMAAKAQLKVGPPAGAPDASAMLQVESSTKGLRLPQVALTTTTTFAPVTTPTSAPAAVGLTVYNTTAGITSSNPLYPAAGIGTYTWDGTGWAAASTVAAITSQDLRAVGTGIFYNHVTKDAGVGFNGTSLGTGDGNLAIGNSAMSAITTGSYNAGLGVAALGTNTTGTSNVAIGPSALLGNTISSNNVAIGSNALSLNGGATGGNIAIGRLTLSKNDGTSPAPSIAIGDGALANITKAGYNIAMGNGAMGSATGGATFGAENIAIGTGALANNTGNPAVAGSGNDNIAIGNGSMDANSTGKLSIAIGHASLSKNTTGDNNLAIGESSLYQNTTGIENVALGLSTLTNNTTGLHNTAVGASSMSINVTGIENTAIGFLSLYNATGSNNTGLGTAAGSSISTGLRNTAVGYSTMSSLGVITGNDNTAIGSGALQKLTTGGTNIAVGHVALTNALGASSNVAVGDQSLVSLTTGSLNTAIGNFSAPGMVSGSNNIAIGNATNLAIPATGSDQMNIGNTIYGTSLPNAASAYGPQANSFVGVLTPSPTAALDINGTTRIRTLPAGAATDKVITADASGNLRALSTPLFNEVVKGQVVIPTSSTVFTNHANATFDTPDFYCVSNAFTAAVTNGAASPNTIIVTPAFSICVYEYTGVPISTTAGIYTFISAFNAIAAPDEFVGNSKGLTNNVSGNVGIGIRTQITIKWVRVDTPANAWGASFGGSVMVVR